jgi:hypothetical protein
MFGGEPRPRPRQIARQKSGTGIGAGGFFSSDFGGGISWSNGGAVTMPYMGGGVYLFFDAAYAMVIAGYSAGGGKWKGTNTPPEMRRTSVNIGAYAKYPNFGIGSLRAFPLLGAEYEISLSGKIINVDGYETVFDGRNNRPKSGGLSALWIRLGGGADISLNENMFIRAEFLYGARMANAFENAEKQRFGAQNTKLGHGVTVRVGAGIEF